MLKMVLLDTDKIPKKSVEQIKQSLGKVGELVTYETTAPDEVAYRCKNAQIILVNKNIINAEAIKSLPNLKYIIVVATGFDNVDVVAANQHGVKVSNIPTYGSQTVAQHTIALLLELTDKVGWLTQMVKQGHWNGTGHKHRELADLTLGVFGFGNIAQKVIKIALALGMKILVCGSKGRDANYTSGLDVRFVGRDEIFAHSDVITLHCPVTDYTRELVNKTSLALMKPGGLIINASRGALINEEDLYQALINKHLAGAALDVLQIEPAKPENPLLSLDNCYFTPHNAWVSNAALKRWLDDIEACVLNFRQNKFINLV